MEAPIELLLRAVAPPLGTVVHVGADLSDLQVYAGLEIAQLLIAQGDRELAARLSSAARDLPSTVHIVARAVAPTGGPMSWHHHSLPALDGPVDTTPLRAIYPRLVCLERSVVDAMSFVALVDQAVALPQSPAPKVLVLDVPGQEHALLQALPEARLLAFDWLLVRRHGLAAAHERSGPWAAANPDWSRVAATDAEDSMWPVTLYRLDRQAREQRLLCELCARLEHELHASQLQLDAARQQTVLAAEQGASLTAALQSLRAEQAESARQQEQERQRAWADLAAATARLETLAAELQQAQDRSAGSDATVAHLRVALAESERRREAEIGHARAAQTSAAARLGALAIELKQAQDRGEAADAAAAQLRAALTDARHAHEAELAQARSEQESTAARLRALIDELQRTHERSAGSQAAAIELQAALAESERRHEAEAAHARTERDAATARLETLAAELQQADERSAGSQAAAMELRAALAESERRHEAELGQARTERDATASRLGTLAAELQQVQERGARDNTALAELRAALAEAEQLHASELGQARAERDAVASRLDDLAAQLQQAQSNHDQLVRQRDDERKHVAQELADLRATSARSTKLQLLRENDLRELQTRHQALLEKSREQQELLNRLAQRLTVAMRYFQRLSLEGGGPALADERPADAP